MQTTSRAKDILNNGLLQSCTYLLRQMINADVEGGCEAFVFDFGADALAVAEGAALSNVSLLKATFLSFAII
jgi:hypothetical protein